MTSKYNIFTKGPIVGPCVGDGNQVSMSFNSHPSEKQLQILADSARSTALERLLVEKGILTEKELRDTFRAAYEDLLSKYKAKKEGE